MEVGLEVVATTMKVDQAAFEKLPRKVSLEKQPKTHSLASACLLLCPS